MGTADLLIIAFILFFAVRGVIRGFIIEVVGILGLILAFIFSFMIYAPMHAVTKSIGFSGNAASIAAYILGFIIIYVLIIILGHLIHKTLRVIHLGWLNRLIGFLVGALKGTIIAGLLLWVIVYIMPKDSKLISDINTSPVANVAMEVVPYVYEKLNSIAGIDRINPFSK